MCIFIFVCESQTFKIDEEVISDCLALQFSTSVPRDQLIEILHRRESHPLRVAYDLILDHKNAKIRIDGKSHEFDFVASGKGWNCTGFSDTMK